MKSIEKSIKSRINKLVASKALPIIIDSPLNMMNDFSKKILILRHDRIGDVLISSGIIRNLRAALPDSQIDILLSRKNFNARKSIEKYVDNVLLYGKELPVSLNLIGNIRKQKYDLIIDFLDNPSTTSATIIKLSSTASSLGFNHENANVYSHAVPLINREENHIIDRLGNLLLPFGLDANSLELSPEYPISSSEKAMAEQKVAWQYGKTRIAINIAGSNINKFWGRNNFINLINLIKSSNTTADSSNHYDLRLFGSRGYIHELGIISEAADIQIAPISEAFHDYAAMISTTDYIITPDTAAVHLASAFKKPCLCLFTTSNNVKAMPWFPYKSKFEAVIIKDNLALIDPIKAFDAFIKLTN